MFGTGVGGLSDFSSDHLTTDEAKRRVSQMKTSFALLEFHFYNAFDGYSGPPDYSPSEVSMSWTRPEPLTTQVDTAIIQAYIQEIRTPPAGRAWLQVNAMACDPGQCTPILGSHSVEDVAYLDVVAPNAARATAIAAAWADYANALGFHGIFWSSMGEYGSCEGCNWPEFLTTAHTILAEKGLEQNAEFIDSYGWSSTLLSSVNPTIRFPVWSTWGTAQQVQQYKAEFFELEQAGVWGTQHKIEDGNAVSTIIDRMLEAACHNAGYLAIVDGTRRIYSDYYPDARPLTEAEVSQISDALGSPNPQCEDSRMYIEAQGLRNGVHLGLDVATFEFNVDWHTVDRTQFLNDFRQSMLDAGADPATIDQVELQINPGGSPPPTDGATAARRMVGVNGVSRMSGGVTGRRMQNSGTTVVTVIGPAEDVNATRTAFADAGGITVQGHGGCEMDAEALPEAHVCGATPSVTATSTTTTKTSTSTSTSTSTTTTKTLTSTRAYNCSVNVSTCMQDWDEAKQAYCAEQNETCTVQTFSARPYACLDGSDPLSWTEERRSWCCSHEFQGCEDGTPWWKEALLIFVVGAIAVVVAWVAAVMCMRTKQMNFQERELKNISQVPLPAPGDDPVDEELATPLVSALTPALGTPRWS
jgi:hypothetical protein